MPRVRRVPTVFCSRHNLSSKPIHESFSCRREVPDSDLAGFLDCVLRRFAMDTGRDAGRRAVNE